jgi:putative NADPH-quinone reductase
MIRTIEQLIQKNGEERIWRRKELTELKALVNESKSDTVRSRLLIRASVAILYAHWEGFVKKSAQHYLEFVNSQGLSYNELTANFVGIALKSEYTKISESGKDSSGVDLANFFYSEMGKKSKISYKTSIKTKSNLSSKVLLDILITLGVNNHSFQTRLHFIDTKLVDPRNQIAHGEFLELSISDYLEIHDDVLTLIDTFKNEVENSAALKKYIK